jgi:hypothetical protein
MKPEHRDEARRLAAMNFFRQLVIAAKAQADVVTWRSEGGFEGEELFNALASGGTHPVLRRWEELKATLGANRPGPDLLEQGAHRTVVLMVEALHRAGLGKGAARKRAAEALRDVFPEATIEAIRYWRAGYSPVPGDERLIADTLKRCGRDHGRIANWFVGLVRFTLDPVAARTARRILIKR